MKRWAAGVLGVVVLAALGMAFAMRPRLPAAERGRRLAERTGCFGCHGPGGVHGANNPGRTDRTVPNFQDDVMMYAKTPDEIHEWIHNGVTRKRAASVTWRGERDRGAVRMPAFKGTMSEHDMDDLVAYVMVMAGQPEPSDSLAARGLQRADELGCAGCHGPGGRLARPNPRSFKGYIPSWDGADFAELVSDSVEFRQWVERGVSPRFERNPFANHFLRRAAVRMPAYRKHLAPDDVPALWAYVTWLRSGAAASSHPMQEHDHE